MNTYWTCHWNAMYVRCKIPLQRKKGLQSWWGVDDFAKSKQVQLINQLILADLQHACLSLLLDRLSALRYVRLSWHGIWILSRLWRWVRSSSIIHAVGRTRTPISAEKKEETRQHCWRSLFSVCSRAEEQEWSERIIVGWVLIEYLASNYWWNTCMLSPAIFKCRGGALFSVCNAMGALVHATSVAVLAANMPFKMRYVYCSGSIVFAVGKADEKTAGNNMHSLFSMTLLFLTVASYPPSSLLFTREGSSSRHIFLTKRLCRLPVSWPRCVSGQIKPSDVVVTICWEDAGFAEQHSPSRQEDTLLQ
jgi:hypothetical protein